MSEPRKSIEDWLIKLRTNCGQKSVKIELYRAAMFNDRFDIFDRSNFFPKPPLQNAARRRYWQERFRVRVDGKWHGTGAKYHTYSMDEVYEKIVKKIVR